MPLPLCSQCGRPLPQDAPSGHCPFCILSHAFDVSLLLPALESSELTSGAEEFGDYELLNEIARGGMGVVWRARQRKLQRLVAVKLIRDGVLAGPEEIARFRMEAAAAGRLHHPGIVNVYEVGEVAGQLYYSMELIEGPSLAKELRQGPLDPFRAAELLKHVAQAVEHAHSRGVLHRDLKPANILLDSDGRPRVTDFGVAKLLNFGTSLTLTGAVLGSPHYMSPEQAQGHDLDLRSDVYSLGTILYECLTGRPPFNAATPLDTMRLVIEQSPPAARTINPTLPRDLNIITMRCLAKETRARYATAQALADDLGRFLNGEPIEARATGPLDRIWRWSRRKPAYAALAFLLVAAPNVIIGLQFRHQHALRQASRRAERSEALTRESLYTAELSLAWQASEAGDLMQARTLLARHLSTNSRFEGRWLSFVLRREQQFLSKSTNHVLSASIDPSGPEGPSIGVLFTNAFSVQSSQRDFFESTCWLDSPEVALPPITLALDSRRKKIILSDQAGLLLWTSNCSPAMRLAAGRFERIAIRKSDGRIAAARNNQTNSCVQVFDGADARPVGERFFSEVCGLAWQPVSEELWVGTRDGSIWYWDVSQDRCTVQLRGAAPVFGIAFSPDFSLAVRATSDHLLIHELKSGRPVTKIELAVDQHVHLAWSPDARMLAVSDIAGTIQVCGTQDGQIYKRFQGHFGAVADLAWEDSNSLISAGTDGTVQSWQVENPFTNLGEIHLDVTGAIVFSADSQRMALGSLHKPLTVWDAHKGLVIARYASGVPVGLSTSGGKMLARFGSSFQLVELGSEERHSAIPTAFRNFAIPVDGSLWLSADARVFITQSTNGSLVLLQATTGNCLATSPGGITIFAASPDGRKFALGNERETWWWDSETGTTNTIVPHRATALVVGPRESLVVVGDELGRIEVWEPAKKGMVQSFAAHIGAIRSLALTSDELTLASSGDDRTTRLWHPTLGRQFGIITRVMLADVLRFSPNDDVLLAGGVEECRIFPAPLSGRPAHRSASSTAPTFWSSGYSLIANGKIGNHSKEAP